MKSLMKMMILVRLTAVADQADFNEINRCNI